MAKKKASKKSPSRKKASPAGKRKPVKKKATKKKATRKKSVKKKRAKRGRPATDWASRERAGDVARKRDARASAKDISIPPPEDIDRRTEMEDNPFRWLSYYLPNVFYGNWNPTRTELVKAIVHVAHNGGNEAKAGERSIGKTKIVEGLALLFALTGLIKFLVTIAASGDFALGMQSNVKYYLETSDRLYADYPEVCVPIRQLAGANQRANTQTVDGERTRIVWSGKKLILPTVPGSRCSGTVWGFYGIEAALRGMNVGELRPELCLIDDPDTRESAYSEKKTTKRIETIERDIAGLAGDRKKMAIVMLNNVMSRMSIGYVFNDLSQKTNVERPSLQIHARHARPHGPVERIRSTSPRRETRYLVIG